MSEAKDKHFLDRLKAKVSPQAAMSNIIASLMPQLAAQLQAMEQPVEEGGVLHPDESKVGYLVIQLDGEVAINLVPIAQDPATGRMYLKRPLRTFAGDDAFSKLQNDPE